MSRTIEVTIRFTISEKYHQLTPVEAFEENTDKEIESNIKQFFNWTHIKAVEVLSIKDEVLP